MYRSRTADLYRIASDGTGVLRDGDIHPDLSSRLAEEAARTARYILQMCIRAIDYCPPFGITFGDYLRAVITADAELNPDDAVGYRLAFVESFRQWGIYPEGMRSLSVEALMWPKFRESVPELFTIKKRSILGSQQVSERPDRWHDNSEVFPAWTLESDRYQAWDSSDTAGAVLWAWLVRGEGKRLASQIGIVLDLDAAPTIYRSETTNAPAVEIGSVRPAVRRSTRGDLVRHLIVEVTQRRRGYFDANVQQKKDSAKTDFFDEVDNGDFIYRAGCTLLFDPEKHRILRVIRTPGTIADDGALSRVRDYLGGGGLESSNAFDGPLAMLNNSEPFALLHRGAQEEADD